MSMNQHRKKKWREVGGLLAAKWRAVWGEGCYDDSVRR
jgi:hypothetical protein